MAYFGAGNQRASPVCCSGGLISHGNDEAEYYGLVDTYAGRIPKGENPADVPVVQSTKVELLKPQDRQGARPHRPALDARPRGRGDPMMSLISGICTKPPKLLSRPKQVRLQ